MSFYDRKNPPPLPVYDNTIAVHLWDGAWLGENNYSILSFDDITVKEENVISYTVIHDGSRIDRAENVGKLFNGTPNLLHEPAMKVNIEDQNANAVRGCSLSHLSAIEKALARGDDWLCVLEDDAERIEGVAFDITTVPDDASVIVLGGDTEKHDFNCADGFARILPPFFGSQAVLYNLRLLRKTPWLFNAYKLLASHSTGTRHGALCYESILIMSCNATNTGIYRPLSMLYTTTDSFSDREGMMMEARTKNLILEKPQC